MTDNNESNLNDLLVLYACGNLEPEVAAEVQKELQKRPDLAAQVELLRMLDCAMTLDLTPPDDIEDDTDEEPSTSESTAADLNQELAKPTPESAAIQVITHKKRFLTFRTVAGNIVALALFLVLGYSIFTFIVNPSQPHTEIADNSTQSGSSSQTESVDIGSKSGSVTQPGTSNVSVPLSPPYSLRKEIMRVLKENRIEPEKLLESSKAGIDNDNPDPQLQTFIEAVEEFNQLLDRNDFSTVKAEDFKEISKKLTPEVLGDDKARNAFKKVVDEAAELVGASVKKK